MNVFKLAKYYQKNAQNPKAYHNRKILKSIFQNIDEDIIYAAQKGKTEVKVYLNSIPNFCPELTGMIKQNYIQKGFIIKNSVEPRDFCDFIISWSDEEEK